MITVKLPYTTDGKDTVVLGLTAPELEALMSNEPLSLDFSHMGIELNLILIARPHDNDCIKAVKEITDDDTTVYTDNSMLPGLISRLANGEIGGKKMSREERRLMTGKSKGRHGKAHRRFPKQ